jgi:hypothetical protein
MIIKAMAITRCPYCHAIIDEADKYCNNCGTQLLFSEDEEVEEEIPGEKIVDAEVEEKDYTVEEPESERRQRPAPAKDMDAEIDAELEDELPEGTGKTAIDELMTREDAEDENGEGGDEPPEEVILVDETEGAGEGGTSGELSAAAPVTGETNAAEPEDKDGEEEPEEEELAEDLEDEIEESPVPDASLTPPPAKEGTGVAEASERPSGSETPEGSDVEYVAQSEGSEEAATAGEASLRPATFDSQELEHLGRTVELGREKIDKFIEVMAAKDAVPPPVPAEPAEASSSEAEPEPRPEAQPASRTGPEPSTGTLPPWARTMKGAPVFLEETRPVSAPQTRGESTAPDTEEVEIFPRRRRPDSTIGLPEKVGQSPLPFATQASEAGEEGEEEAEDLEIEQRREETAGEEASEGIEAEGEEPAMAPAEEAAAPSPLGPRRGPAFPEPGGRVGRLGQAEVLAAGEIAEVGARPPFRFAVFLKSKAFDLLFVGVFWLVALWLAAASMGVSLFDVLGEMSGSMILLYAAFVLLYFFLFEFFLGETLGDRLFRPREQG